MYVYIVANLFLQNYHIIVSSIVPQMCTKIMTNNLVLL